MADRARRVRRNALAAILVVAVLVLAWFTWSAVRDLQRHSTSQGERLQAAERSRETAEQAAQRDRQVRDQQIRQLAAQVRKLGGKPNVNVPSQPPAAAPPEVEIAAAVARYLREHPAPAGRPPSMAEVLTTVTGYLREHPPAAGPQGKSGQDGKPGKDGVDGKDGAQGPAGEKGDPPSDEQIRAAVQAYLEAHPLNCPAGTSLDRLTVVTTDGGPREIVVCVPQ